MTLVGQFFVVTVVMVALMQPTTGPESFMTDVSLDIPLFENINDTVRL
jgi:hypothetical protein